MIFLQNWKHHLLEICQGIRSLALKAEGKKELFFILNSFGERGVVDIYTGALPSKTIIAEIRQFLQESAIQTRKEYRIFLKSRGSLKNRGYYYIHTISDGSQWVLREGKEELISSYDLQTFVHIHPGRFSPHTFRIKVNTLKTALVYVFYLMTGEKEGLELFHFVRKSLQLSPVPAIPSRVADMIQLLKERMDYESKRFSE